MNNTRQRFWAFFGLAFAVATIVLIVPYRVAADPYGEGGYSTCIYQAACPVPTTQTTLPSGLKIAVNLADDQIIPRSGYTITVTPVNGQGNTFKQADIYIDGILAATALPDGTGTASWRWDPVRTPGTTVKITVTDANGTSTTQEFHVRIADASSETAGTAPPPAGGTQQPTKPKTGIAVLLDIAGSGLDKLSQAAVNAIRSLPTPLAYSFPYILFGLLGLNVLLLLYQMNREVREYHILRSLLAREKLIAESKKTFMELVSHYLRTPITILMGGIDMLPKDSNSATTRALQSVVHNMGAKIEGLIADTRTASEIALSGRGDTALSATALWRQAGLFIPVLLIIIILIPYNYLAQHGGGLTLSQVNLATQAIIFLALVTATYLVVRQLRLRRRDQYELQRLSDAQAASVRVRDELITSTATSLRTDITTIDELVGQLNTSQAANFISDGQKRFHDVLTKCTIAASLRGSHSESTTQTTTLTPLLHAAKKPLANQLAGYTIRGGELDTRITTQNPELVSYVLHTVLKNALTYSKPGTPIDVHAHPTTSGTDITITDHGEGMPAAKVSLLFQPFFKAEGAEKFNHEGMGFSLYLDKLIMEYLGGSINLVSEKGHGTTVTLHLPV